MNTFAFFAVSFCSELNKNSCQFVKFVANSN